jgi:two-component system LytT family response regulator
MKAVIIDDERSARLELRQMLESHPDVEIAGEAANASEALSRVAALHPDLLFLDVEMPGRSGFDLLKAMPAPHPRIVFCTAFDEFALRAFEVNALDYLLKPVSATRLAQALERVRSELRRDGVPPEPAGDGGVFAEDDQVFVRAGDRCWFVPLRSITLFEADGNYTRVHFGTDKPLLYRSIGLMEERLPARLFLRANRSQIVNLSAIRSISRWFSNTLKVTLTNGTEVEFSRRQALLLRNRTSL